MKFLAKFPAKSGARLCEMNSILPDERIFSIRAEFSNSSSTERSAKMHSAQKKRPTKTEIFQTKFFAMTNAAILHQLRNFQKGLDAQKFSKKKLHQFV
jgi:hypothetical protein